MSTRSLRCRLEQLPDWHPNLFVEAHVAACVAVLSQYSESPAVIDVECVDVDSRWLRDDRDFRLLASWTAETRRNADRLRSTVQAAPLVEMAATAVGLVLSHRVVRLGVLDVTKYGKRADFRSLRTSSMLEISGTEVAGELVRRHREKVMQAISNPFGWGAYVVVCAFSSEGHRVRFSYHPPREHA